MKEDQMDDYDKESSVQKKPTKKGNKKKTISKKREKEPVLSVSGDSYERFDKQEKSNAIDEDMEEDQLLQNELGSN